MSTDQYAKIRAQIQKDPTLRVPGPGNTSRMLAYAVRAENGSNVLTPAQYTTMVAPYKRRSF